MSSSSNIHQSIVKFSSTISKQTLGLVSYSPDKCGTSSRCFENVYSYAQKNGGREQFGWMFQQRTVASIPEASYLIAIHHAVWYAPNGHLIDITPFHNDRKHHPLSFENNVLFLVDDNALPVTLHEAIAPLPSRFYALNDNMQLIQYVQKLNEKEKEQCKKIYDELLAIR